MKAECTLCGSTEHSEDRHWEQCALLLDGARGVYLPQNFAEGYHVRFYGVSEEQKEILLAGPESEYYWETWDEVLSNSRFTFDDGRQGFLYQDSDLWLVPDTLI